MTSGIYVNSNFDAEFLNEYVPTSQGMVNPGPGYTKSNLAQDTGKNPLQKYSEYWYNQNKNLNNVSNSSQEIQQGLISALQTYYKNNNVAISPIRNAKFAFPVAAATPSFIGTAGSLPIGALTQPRVISSEPVAGQQINNVNRMY